MLINVEESVVSFMNKDIIDISIGSVNPDSFSLKRLLEYSVNSPVVYGLSYASNRSPLFELRIHLSIPYSLKLDVGLRVPDLPKGRV